MKLKIILKLNIFLNKKITIKRTWNKYDGKRNSRVDVIFSRGKQE